MKIWDTGPWEVRDTDRGVMIDSDDFTHDASLIVYGDFRNKKQMMEYGKFIAGILNRHTEALKVAIGIFPAPGGTSK